MIALYLALLASGVGLFVLSYVAPFRAAALLRTRYPQHWQVIATAAQGRFSGFRVWANMQQVLRSPALPALGDATINRWRLVWRYSQWLGWLCWLAALTMRLWVH
ncbi:MULTISPECIES: hypothetical protein [Rhodanobacter]|uniref:hypothetical protein n=1 Tax=Rhodanobacter TaxID=75309 RepID=UPI0004009F00|nr:MULTISPECIES: hypothetical protein [Rhodanobacter]TAN15859.1 MAG: hypothetical protein EPN35_12430 [Rhodanobacter sp.]UJJ56186.1 hypothetical protein LRK53_07380 [Rhodanobacter thiooxydans]